MEKEPNNLQFTNLQWRGQNGHLTGRSEATTPCPQEVAFFLLDNQGSYPHCIHKDELHIPAQHLHKFVRDDVHRFDKGGEFQSCMLLHTSHLLLVATIGHKLRKLEKSQVKNQIVSNF